MAEVAALVSNNPSKAKPATYSNPKRPTSGNIPAALAVARLTRK